jgi:hypothetical protein
MTAKIKLIMSAFLTENVSTAPGIDASASVTRIERLRNPEPAF